MKEIQFGIQQLLSMDGKTHSHDKQETKSSLRNQHRKNFDTRTFADIQILQYGSCFAKRFPNKPDSHLNGRFRPYA